MTKLERALHLYTTNGVCGDEDCNESCVVFDKCSPLHYQTPYGTIRAVRVTWANQTLVELLPEHAVEIMEILL